MPISPEDVVKVITDPRFVELWRHRPLTSYFVTIERNGVKDSTTAPDPLSALAWARGMFDQWDSGSQREDTHVDG